MSKVLKGTEMKEIDHTARRLGVKTPDGKIVICERCGRHGAYREFLSRDRLLCEIIHRKEFRTFPFPHWHYESDDFCMLDSRAK